MKTALIDYGASNLHSVYKALDRAGLRPTIASRPAHAAGADALVLPGQGHFGQVMRSFLASGLAPSVREHLDSGRPFLGICVGLQLLTEGSDEAPDTPGLGLLAGRARRFPDTRVSVPQMGWNRLTPVGDSPLLRGIAPGSYVNFANSYYVDFDGVDHAGAHSEYGGVRFLSAVSIGPIHATQFHPEKSQHVGLAILANFRTLVASAAAA